MDRQAKLSEKLKEKTATIGVIGLGYVGQPMMRKCLEAGYDVVGFDKSYEVIAELRSDGDDTLVQNALHNEDLRLYIIDEGSNAISIRDCDVVLICVPTPITESRAPDMTAVKDVCRNLFKYGRNSQLVILESTVYPGATRDLFGGLSNSWVVYSPERIDPGNNDDPGMIPKIVGSPCNEALNLAARFYTNLGIELAYTHSWESAEAAKLLENVYRCVNIALVNELKMIFNKMGVDIWEVIRLASTKPFGFQPFYPGPGMGGHCIPVDPFYLSWAAKRVGEDALFIERAGQINNRMPNYVAGRIMRELNEVGKCMKGSTILLLGAAYKPEVSDTRNSPTYALKPLLEQHGAHVTILDPLIPEHDLGDQINIDGFDCVVVMTPHEIFDWVEIRNLAQLLIDTRGVYQDETVIQV